MSRWIHPVASSFAAVAGAGLALSAIAQIALLFGSRWYSNDVMTVLTCGMTIVWVAAGVIARPLTVEFKSKDFWKAALRGCPQWMRYTLYGLMGYGILSFFAFVAYADPERTSGPTGRMTGGYSLLIWGNAIAFAILCSARNLAFRDTERKCVNGHSVGTLAQFCEQCGQPAVKQVSDRRP
jgi:hypothetical protein